MKEQKQSPSDDVQGEGDYRSARRYKKDLDTFIAKKGGEIPEMAKDAEQAREGIEGSELDAAEQKGKSKARH